MITTILLDLDGTLLPMDQDIFAKRYIRDLTAVGARAGYSPMLLSAAILAGTAAMVQNDGRKTNKTLFWDTLEEVYGGDLRRNSQLFDQYYETEFQQLRNVCGYTPKAAELIRWLKSRGYRMALATNPLFPAPATFSRIRWAGLRQEDFELVTTYESARYCKPNPEYYRQVLRALDVSPEECLMVGNDAAEDMVAGELGMKVFLLTDCLINKGNADLSPYPQGSFEALTAYLTILNPRKEESIQSEPE